MRAFCTDLDGTLRDPVLGIHPDNLAALEELGRRGVTRVVVTGRSLHHARKVLAPEAPLDWLIFASGAGQLRWPDGACSTQAGLSGELVRELAARLDQLPLSYSIHAPAPHSHEFAYRRRAADGTDFDQRLERNHAHGRPLSAADPAAGFADGASQFLVFAPAESDWPARLSAALPDLRVLHSTSPLDGRTLWIELQPREICKSGGAARLLVDQLGIPAANCRALGNDHNDLDLLEWAGAAAVVANAPAELRGRFPVVAACADGGAARAIRAWLAES